MLENSLKPREIKVGSVLGDMHGTTLDYLLTHEGQSDYIDLSGYRSFKHIEDWSGFGLVDWQAYMEMKLGYKPRNKYLTVLEVREEGTAIIAAYYHDKPTKGGICVLHPR